MKLPHLFEFMDLQQLPSSLRTTLREILECGNAKPFRPYYSWAADQTLRAAIQHGATTIVELGAGTAPLTRHMARDPRSQGLKLVACDSNPDRLAYEALQESHPGKVQPIYEPVDFAHSRDWGSRTLLVLSATLHHVPATERPRVIAAMTNSADRIIVFEPLRKTILSALFVFPSVVPALLLPLLFIRRAGILRRILWCWLVPLAPFMFWWDGLVTCLRQWSEAEWQAELQKLLDQKRTATISHSAFCQQISW